MARGTGLHSSLAIISSHDGFLSLEDFRMINNAHFLLMTVNIRNWSVAGVWWSTIEEKCLPAPS